LSPVWYTFDFLRITPVPN